MDTPAGNGLSADAYRAVARCEPQVVEALLSSLADAGIAAYAEPYEGSVGGYLETRPPERPMAQVWVDSAAVSAAREMIEARYALPTEPPAAAEDAAWQEIVASLLRSGPPVGASSSPPPGAAPVDSPEPPDAPEPPEPPEEHFVPPPPPPVPVPTGPSAYGIAAVVAGFVVLLVPTLAGDPVSPALLVLAIVAIVGGFATLVARMREGPPTDSGPDDGAVL